VDLGAADGAAGGGLDPGHGAGPVEAVRAGQVHQHVPSAEILQANGAPRHRLRRGWPPPQPAPDEPAPGRVLGEHLPLQHAGRVVVAAVATRCLGVGPRTLAPAGILLLVK
jgi:hypothetical protein